jgi:hypothetical protein
MEVNTALIEVLVGVNIFVPLWAFEEKGRRKKFGRILRSGGFLAEYAQDTAPTFTSCAHIAVGKISPTEHRCVNFGPRYKRALTAIQVISRDSGAGKMASNHIASKLTK